MLTILCDSHVHIHDGHPLDAVLSSAQTNFQALASSLGMAAQDTRFALWLTESAGTDRFAALWGRPPSRPAARWHLEPTREREALIARDANGDSLILIAGRQIVCREKIEILALGTRESISDGAPLISTLNRILAVEALPVLPWGFGKWLGARGATIRRLVLEQEEPAAFFIGDILGRPDLPGLGSPFRLAALGNIRVLSGSDPLPVPGGYTKIGRYGTAIDVTAEHELLPSRLKALLRDPGTRVTTVGKRLPLPGAIREQVFLRLNGHRGLRRT